MNKELTSEERYYISTTLKNGSSISQIAIDINRHKPRRWLPVCQPKSIEKLTPSCWIE